MPSIGAGAVNDIDFDELVEEARDILRIAAGLNAELATPFRIAIRSTTAALSDEQVRSALVALVDQDRVVEYFGFGVTFHLMSSGEVPEGGVVSLPEVAAGGMSQADALGVIEAWLAANGSLEFLFFVENGYPMVLLAELLADNWYDAGASPEIYVDDFDSHSINFSKGNLDDMAVEHRPGLLP